MNTCMVGWAHSKFGKHEDQDLESLLTQVALQAVADAGLQPMDIDSIYVGHFNNGLSGQDFTASLALQADEGFRFKPATRVENACATGSAAIHAGLNYLDAGRGKFVLAVGVEKMTAASGKQIAESLLCASYRREESAIQGGFAGIFSEITDAYFARYGDQSEALAHIAAKNHHNGMQNPYAQLRKDLGVEFCNTISEKNPIVVGRVRRTDCSLVSDGAAATVLTTTEIAATMPKAVGFRAAAHVNDFMPMSRRDMSHFSGAERAWQSGLAQAGMDLLDLDLVETHDCFTIAELIEYEAMGLTPRGEGHRAALEGWTTKDGKLPVNPSGGLKSKGHPIGATGVSMHVMGAMQLTGDAGGMQIPDAKTVGIFNMGGAAVVSYMSVLERVR